VSEPDGPGTGPDGASPARPGGRGGRHAAGRYTRPPTGVPTVPTAGPGLPAPEPAADRPGEDGPAGDELPGPGRPAPPRRWSRPGRAGLLLLVLPAVAAAVAVPRATRGTALDPAAVQRDVAAQYQQLHGGTLALRCSERMTVAAGRSYRCTGTSTDEGAVRITIRVTGPDGGYTWAGGT